MDDQGIKKVQWTLSIGFPGAKRKGEFEIENYATEDDMYEMAEEIAMQHVEISCKIIEP